MTVVAILYYCCDNGDGIVRARVTSDRWTFFGPSPRQDRRRGSSNGCSRATPVGPLTSRPFAHLYMQVTWRIDHILYTWRVTVNTKSYWGIERNMLLVFRFQWGFFSFCNHGDCDFHENLKVNNITNYSLSVFRNNVEVCALSHRYYIIPLTKWFVGQTPITVILFTRPVF